MVPVNFFCFIHTLKHQIFTQKSLQHAVKIYFRQYTRNDPSVKIRKRRSEHKKGLFLLRQPSEYLLGYIVVQIPVIPDSPLGKGNPPCGRQKLQTANPAIRLIQYPLQFLFITGQRQGFL